MPGAEDLGLIDSWEKFSCKNRKAELMNKGQHISSWAEYSIPSLQLSYSQRCKASSWKAFSIKRSVARRSIQWAVDCTLLPLADNSGLWLFDFCFWPSASLLFSHYLLSIRLWYLSTSCIIFWLNNLIVRDCGQGREDSDKQSRYSLKQVGCHLISYLGGSVLKHSKALSL